MAPREKGRRPGRGTRGGQAHGPATVSLAFTKALLRITGLKDNQKVTFDIENGRDGRESAVNLQLA
jgi:hypothetical protein